MPKGLLLSAVLLFFLGGCASRTPQTDALISKKNSYPIKAKVTAAPFIAQSENYCGPAVLTMASLAAGKKTTMKEVAPLIYTPGAKGTFKSDMLTGAARLGLFGVPISGFDSLIEEINKGRPVIVFRNLGFDWYPLWHYSLVYGYNLDKNFVEMHSGKEEGARLKLERFERSWNRADYWAMVTLSPGELTENSSEWDSSRAAAYLDAFGHKTEAILAYKAILEKWPNSSVAAIGLGNLAANEGRYAGAEKFYRRALKNDPELEAAKNNLAFVLEKQGK